MTQRGTILRGTNPGPGLVNVAGRQYTFRSEAAWRSDVPPRVGMLVEVLFNDTGMPVALNAISEDQLAQEAAHKAFDLALQRDPSLVSRLLQRVGAGRLLAKLRSVAAGRRE